MLITWIVIILALVTVAQLMRVSAIAKKIHNKREEDISDADNSFNGTFLLLFMLFFLGSTVYLWATYGNGLLPEAASEHGKDIDFLFNINWIIVFAVFFFTNALLFGFAFKYRGKKGKKAYYFPHDTRLELIWTIVPAVVLAVIIILGLRTWNNVTGKISADAQIVEVYGQQFNWMVRYAGDDNKLGFADYKLITTENPLGVASPASIEATLVSMDGIINGIDDALKADSAGVDVYAVEELHEMHSTMDKYIRLREKVEKMKAQYQSSDLTVGDDDIISQIELHLVKGQDYQFIFRSKDVLHSAYFPHFRAQMNCVPGMRTKFSFKPTISTAEMREIRGNKDFNYVLLCNKICGESHSNMKMIVVVDETQADFDAWAQENTKTAIAKNN
ncbi:MAG: cytochrome c oxidase subunit II [Crocinitomicaceae bacterium]